MTETLQASGQDMKQEAPEALDGIEGHEPLTVAMGRVFPPQGHPPVLARQQAPMRDRYAMRRARAILRRCVAKLCRSQGGWIAFGRYAVCPASRQRFYTARGVMGRVRGVPGKSQGRG